MINFRFHLVSLIAVFLALGLGILVGSTVIDQRIVNRLDSEIKQRAQGEHGSARRTSKQLAKRELSSSSSSSTRPAPFVGDGRLDGSSVAVVAERGVDERRGEADGAGAAARRGRRRARGAVARRLVAARHRRARPGRSQSALDLQRRPRRRCATRALDLLARRLAKAPAAIDHDDDHVVDVAVDADVDVERRGDDHDVVDARRQSVDVLDALEQAGFLERRPTASASAFDTFPAHAAHVLVITGDDSHFAGSDLTAAFARALVDAEAADRGRRGLRRGQRSGRPRPSAARRSRRSSTTSVLSQVGLDGRRPRAGRRVGSPRCSRSRSSGAATSVTTATARARRRRCRRIRHDAACVMTHARSSGRSRAPRSAWAASPRSRASPASCACS